MALALATKVRAGQRTSSRAAAQDFAGQVQGRGAISHGKGVFDAQEGCEPVLKFLGFGTHGEPAGLQHLGNGRSFFRP